MSAAPVVPAPPSGRGAGRATWPRLGLLVATLVAPTVLFPAAPVAAATAYVSISGNVFSPASVQVQKGPGEPGFPGRTPTCSSSTATRASSTT